MDWVSKLLHRFFHPSVEADPTLVTALDKVDQATQDFEIAIAHAHSRGVFGPLQEKIRQAADEDEKRLRRRSSYDRYR